MAVIERCGRKWYEDGKTYTCTMIDGVGFAHTVHHDLSFEPEKEWSYQNWGRILLNAAACLMCGEIVSSHGTHDFRTCACGNISVDGGKEYLHWGALHPEHMVDMSVHVPRELPLAKAYVVCDEWFGPKVSCATCGEFFSNEPGWLKVACWQDASRIVSAPECLPCSWRRAEAVQLLAATAK